MRISLPIAPPSVNGLYRNVPGRGRVKTSRYSTWLKHMGWLIKAQHPGHRMITEDVAVSIVIKKARRDLDGAAKAALDLCTSVGVWADDAQVARLTMSFGDIKGMEMTVSLMREAA
jgi:Holliday junction resolvase RusA-like endonuclease